MWTVLLIVINILVIFLFYIWIIHFVFKLLDLENRQFKNILLTWWIQFSIATIIIFCWFLIEFFFLSNSNSPNDLDYLYFIILISTISFTIYYYCVTFLKITKSKKTILLSFNIIYLLSIIWWFGISILFRMFLLNIFTVSWWWMSDYLNSKNKVIVNKVHYKFNEIKRWDIVVFKNPIADHISIKRVVGLPNEKILIKEWKILICNDTCTELNEQYLQADQITTSKCNIEEFETKQWYFLLWDNRKDSLDSRCCFDFNCEKYNNHTITKDKIIGKITIILTPHFKFE